MKKTLRWAMAIIVAILLNGQICVAQTDLVEKTSFSKMNAAQIEQLVNTLVSRYPSVLTKVNIGSSADGRNIYAIQLHQPNQKTEDAKYHGLVESGTHSKEIANPYITIKMIERYAKDLENDKVVPHYNLLNALDNGAIHFVPMSNPDGYDLVKFGPGAIRSQKIRAKLMAFGKGNYSQFKASATGVDLNRNYPADFFSIAKNQWTKVPARTGGGQYASSPSSAYYAGPSLGSEPETKALMAYIQSYDFKYLVSYHSRGNLIYYDRPYLGIGDYNKKSQKYARIAASMASYKMMNYGQALNYNGYLGDYFANQTLGPAVTVETTVSSLPTKASVFDSTFSRVCDIPARFLIEIKKETFSPYWVYLKENVKKNFMDQTYAMAFAEKYSGQFALDKPNLEIKKMLGELNINDGSTFSNLSYDLVLEMNPKLSTETEEGVAEDTANEVLENKTDTGIENTTNTVVADTTGTAVGGITETVSKKVALSQLLAYESGQQWLSSNCILKKDWELGETDFALGQAYYASLHFSNVDMTDKVQSGKVDMVAYVKWVNRKPMVTSVEYTLTLNKNVAGN